jgi:hypothetical protein
MFVCVPIELVTGAEPETDEQDPSTTGEVKRTESNPVSAGAVANPTSTYTEDREARLIASCSFAEPDLTLMDVAVGSDVATSLTAETPENSPLELPASSV